MTVCLDVAYSREAGRADCPGPDTRRGAQKPWNAALVTYKFHCDLIRFPIFSIWFLPLTSSRRVWLCHSLFTAKRWTCTPAVEFLSNTATPLVFMIWFMSYHVTIVDLRSQSRGFLFSEIWKLGLQRIEGLTRNRKHCSMCCGILNASNGFVISIVKRSSLEARHLAVFRLANGDTWTALPSPSCPFPNIFE